MCGRVMRRRGIVGAIAVVTELTQDPPVLGLRVLAAAISASHSITPYRAAAQASPLAPDPLHPTSAHSNPS